MFHDYNTYDQLLDYIIRPIFSLLSPHQTQQILAYSLETVNILIWTQNSVVS